MLADAQLSSSQQCKKVGRLHRGWTSRARPLKVKSNNFYASLSPPSAFAHPEVYKVSCLWHHWLVGGAEGERS